METSVFGCAEGGHACLGNPLPWLLQGPFLAPRQPFKYQYLGVCYSLWVGSVDGFPSLYEGSLAEMEEAWECTDIDFFIPMHTLMYWLPRRSVRDILFLPLFGRAERQWAEFHHTKPPESKARLISSPRHSRSLLFSVSLRKMFSLWLLASVRCCQSRFRKKKRSLHLLFTLWWQPMWLCCGVLWVWIARPALLRCTYCQSRAVSCSSLGCR